MTRYIQIGRLSDSVAVPYVSTDMAIEGDSFYKYAKPYREELYPCWSKEPPRWLRHASTTDYNALADAAYRIVVARTSTRGSSPQNAHPKTDNSLPNT